MLVQRQVNWLKKGKIFTEENRIGKDTDPVKIVY
jgi:hypothetical protein